MIEKRYSSIPSVNDLRDVFVTPSSINQAVSLLEERHSAYAIRTLNDMNHSNYLLPSGLVIVMNPVVGERTPVIDVLARTQNGLDKIIKSLRLNQPADNPSRL